MVQFLDGTGVLAKYHFHQGLSGRQSWLHLALTNIRFGHEWRLITLLSAYRLVLDSSQVSTSCWCSRCLASRTAPQLELGIGGFRNR